MKTMIKWVKNILAIVGGILLAVFAIKKSAELKKQIQQTSNFRKLKGSKTKIQVMNKDGKWRVVDLPKKENGERIKFDEIQYVGWTEGGKGNAEISIKHSIIDFGG